MIQRDSSGAIVCPHKTHPIYLVKAHCIGCEFEESCVSREEIMNAVAEDSKRECANETLRVQVSALLQRLCPAFKYHGRAAHVGWWETSSYVDDLLELTKPNGDSTKAAFRLIVHYPNEHGIPIHVEMFPAPYWDWESVFNGYIEDISELKRIFGFQLGIKLNEI